MRSKSEKKCPHKAVFRSVFPVVKRSTGKDKKTRVRCLRSFAMLRSIYHDALSPSSLRRSSPEPHASASAFAFEHFSPIVMDLLFKPFAKLRIHSDKFSRDSSCSRPSRCFHYEGILPFAKKRHSLRNRNIHY